MPGLMAGATSLVARVTAGTALFILVLAAVHSSDARIAGMMLTFPALNGISLMLAPVTDKRSMARSMLASIALNGVVGVGYIVALSLAARWALDGAAHWVWPLSGLAFTAWLIVCWGMSRGPPIIDRMLFRGFVALAPVLVVLWWVTCPIARASPAGDGAAALVWTHAIRIVLFALTLALLLAACEWLGATNAVLGRLGAFPLLPLFSLATIAEGESTATGGMARLAAAKPAMLLGLLLAMAFVWVYASFLDRLGRATPSRLRRWTSALAGLIAGWIVCAGVIFASMSAVKLIEGCG